MADQDQQFRRRMPSPLTRVSEIKPTDQRVSVVGTVIGKADDGIVVDDGSGRIDVSLEGETKDIPERVRVFGRVVPMEEGFQLQGEFVQDMSKLDLELLNKVRAVI